MHAWQICHLAMVAPLADAAAGVGLLGKSTVGTVASAVLGAGALGCGAFTAWCIYANGQFSYDGKRKLSKQIVEGTADYITLPEGGIGLDMGCGSGALTIACAKRNLQRTMVGIDRWGSEYAAFSKDLREQNAEAEGVSNVSFQKGDACKLDFADETFDAVTSNYVYHNITGKNEQAFHAFPDKDTAFRETFRVLKPGGIFCGCFYIAEQNKQTDWFINHLYIPKGFFAPPFDTVATLYKRLSSLYEEVNLETVESMACFTCRKGDNMVFLLESIAACLIFTLLIKLIAHNRQEIFTNDYPPVVTDKLRVLGLIAEKPPAKKKDIIRKLIALIVFALLFALLLRNVNGIETFWEGAVTAYGLWLVVDWYDFLIVDILLAPFDKFYKASGVSAFDKSAVWFHFKGSVRGMVLGVICALLVGLIVLLL